jgi:ribosome maturation factor RimP
MPARPRGSTALANALSQILTPIAEAAGFDLEAITVTAAGRRSVVRVIVDADGGIDLDAVAEVSRVIADALDEETPEGPAFAGAYVLEVSSPGVDRPLTEPRHWRRNLGRLVKAEVRGAGSSAESVLGRISDVSDPGVTLLLDDGSRVLPWDTLGTGRVQIEFNRQDQLADHAGVDDDLSDDDLVDDKSTDEQDFTEQDVTEEQE